MNLMLDFCIFHLEYIQIVFFHSTLWNIWTEIIDSL